MHKIEFIFPGSTQAIMVVAIMLLLLAVNPGASDEISDSGVDRVKEVLLEKPTLNLRGGDGWNFYYRLRLKGYDQVFKFTGCSYSNCEKEILDLEVGEEVELQFIRSRSSRLPVVALKSDRLGQLLSFDNVMDCNTNGWKRKVNLALIFGVVLCIKVIYDNRSIISVLISKISWRKK